jgi:hypothetical protein
VTDEPDEAGRPADEVGSVPAKTKEPVDEGPHGDVLDALTRIDPTDRWVEVLAAAILAFAVIASAWSAYQATRWSGVQAAAFAQAGALRADSVRASDLADTDFAVDVEFFATWLVGASRGDQVLTTLLEDRFRDEFSAAFGPWLATDPLVNPDAPLTPFEMDEYELDAALVAEDLRLAAEASIAEASEANQNGDNYVLTTVLFASVLFFAGISTKFQGKWAMTGLLGFGFAGFVVGVIILSTFPVH